MGIWDIITGKSRIEKEKRDTRFKDKEDESFKELTKKFNDYIEMVQNEINNSSYSIYLPNFVSNNINEITIEDFEGSTIYVFIKSKDENSDEPHSNSLKIINKEPNFLVKTYEINMKDFMHFDFATNDDNKEGIVKQKTVVYYLDGISIEMIVLPFECYDILNSMYPEKNINSKMFKDIDVIRKEIEEFKLKNKSSINVS